MRLRYKHLLAGAVIASAVAIAVPSNTQCHSINGLPDLKCTPGLADPHVTQANIQQTICVPGYTKTVRPSVAVTSKEKQISMKQYGVPQGTKGEYDHLISLELGGSNDTRNLWFEAGPIPNPKDKVENKLHAEVCSGQITLQQAQSEIVNNWEAIK